MKFTEKYSKENTGGVVEVINAKYIGDFAVRIEFSDHHEKLVDFKPFLKQSKHPDIKKYLNEGLFKNFEIKDGQLDWNDFDMCFPIMDLYHNTILKNLNVTATE